MAYAIRPCRNQDDWARVRAFLREVMLAEGLEPRSWHVARLDYWRWHVVTNGLEKLDYLDSTLLWETKSGSLAAVLNPEGAGEAHLQVHPLHRTPELEAEMIQTAEGLLATADGEGLRTLQVWAHADDTVRSGLLEARGYRRTGTAEHIFQRRLEDPIPEPQVPPGYTVRSLGDGLELLERCYASGLGFHNGSIEVAVGNRRDPSWYRNIQTAPLYRRDLDIVAVAPDGSIGSFCTIWYDDVTRAAYYEPVATVPEHQRKGLGKAVMLEGARRLARMGGLVGSVGGYSERARALYSSFAGNRNTAYEAWKRQL